MFLLGCQKPELQPIPEQIETQSQPEEMVDLSLLCQKLSENMLSINAERTTFALEQINQDLKLCLPLSSLAEQKRLLSLSNQMYDNFLRVDRTALQQSAFENYALDLAQHPTVQQNHFEQLNLRDQYLLKHKGQAYVELFDAGKGNLRYRRNPEYLAKIFAPYMPEAEQSFIENLANQNIQPVISENTLLIEADEIVKRALFWEGYLKQYPKSSYRKDAEYLLQMYSLFLFMGTSESPVSESFLDVSSIHNNTFDEIEKLADIQNSNLALQAQKFIQFIHWSESQRLKQIILPSHLKLSDLQNTHLLAQKQLQHYLGLKSLNTAKPRDCFRDAICD